MPKIFICYRRSDTAMAAGLLRKELARHFGDQQIFRDKEDVPPGADWREEIRLVLSEPATIVLALIGSRWLTERDLEGHRLIDNVGDINRLELETALKVERRTIPVLVGEAGLPSSNDLPEPLRALTAIQAFRLRDDHLDVDVRRVISTLARRGVTPVDAESSPGSPLSTNTGTEKAGRFGAYWPARPVVWVAAAVLATSAAVALYTLASRSDTPSVTVPPNGPSPPIPFNDNAPNFQIVLDRSDVMRERFGNTTKLSEAKKAVFKALELVSDSDNVSYREFGGECKGGLTPTELLLPFSPGKARLEERLNALTTTNGQPTIVSAVVEATGNFNDARFKESRLNKIILITGGFHECDDDPSARIKERLRFYPDVEVDLHLIGAGLTLAAQSALKAMAKGSGPNVTVHNVSNPAELDDALEEVLLVERRVTEVTKAVEILDQANSHLRRAAGAIVTKDYGVAEQALDLARGTLERTVIPEPESRQPEDVRQLLDLALECRKDQQRMLDAAKVLIAESKSENAAGERTARTAFNAASSQYTKRVARIGEIGKKLVARSTR
jgi:hypothetical protein